MAYLRTGNFLNRSQVFITRDGSLASGSSVTIDHNSVLEPGSSDRYYNQVQERISISDRILNGDLIPRLMTTLGSP